MTSTTLKPSRTKRVRKPQSSEQKKAKAECDRTYHLQTHYGLTAEARDRLFEGQGSVCALCKTDTPTIKGWMVDHCHKTGAVRGILCHHCNSALGLLKDNPDTLRAAITYLGK